MRDLIIWAVFSHFTHSFCYINNQTESMPTTLSLFILAVLVVVVSSGECGVGQCISCYMGVCTQCVDSSYLTLTKICLPCSDSNCRTCSRDACSYCQSGHYLDFITQRCQPCLKLNCLTCRSDGNCDACMQGHYQYRHTGGITICESCSSNCVMCSSKEKCETCQEGHFIVKAGDGSFCQSCQANQC